MGSKLFGQFLLERGLISREALLEAVKHQKSIEVALHTGTLQLGQAEVLNKLKSERWLFLGEALIEKGFMTRQQLGGLIAEYRRQESIPDTDVLPLLKELPEKDVINSFVRATVDMFRHYTKEDVEILAVGRAGGEPGGLTYVFSQQVAGEKDFRYALAMPEEMVLSVAARMLQERAAEIDAMVLDAVSEFVNVIVGQGCARISMNTTRVTVEPPQVMMRAMLARIMPREAWAVGMKTTGWEFQALFFFAGEDGRLAMSL